jgi:hypothetical protein
LNRHETQEETPEERHENIKFSYLAFLGVFAVQPFFRAAIARATGC